MSAENRRIFYSIALLVVLVVAGVWYATEPSKPAPKALLNDKVATTSPADIISVLDTQKPITHLRVPGTIIPATTSDHVDPRIAVSYMTSADGYDRIVRALASLFVYVFTH